MTTEVLSGAQRRVAGVVLDEEGARREHLVVALSGAHAYGFPSPDSDLDLKAIHIDATRRFFGFDPTPTGAERAEVIDGVEIDYSSNEVGAALVGILAGNGNYLERVLGPHLLRRGAALASLQPIVQASLSRRVYRHYRGFAAGVLREADAAEQPTVKKILYVLRTALTGVHALLAARVVTDVTALGEAHGFAAVRELVELKRAGERVTLAPEALDRWRGEIARAFTLLDEARERSPLPEEAPNRGALEEWLVAVRLARL